MAGVHLRASLWASLRRFAGGQEVVEAATLGQMPRPLARTHPALKAGVSAAGEARAGIRSLPCTPPKLRAAITARRD